MVLVDVAAVLEFFDEAVPGTGGHASAVVGVAGEDLGAALIVHHFESQGLTAEVLPDRCTQGTKRGKRLDRWILTDDAGTKTLYQVEIKNWSAHAIGGRAIRRVVSEDELRRFKIARWADHWTGETFSAEQAQKVLIPMRSPRPGIPVEPLACFWTPMHPTGADEPLFSVPLSNHASFSRVHVFSMSAYLRSLRVPRLSLRLPNVAARRDWLSRLFPAELRPEAV